MQREFVTSFCRWFGMKEKQMLTWFDDIYAMDNESHALNNSSKLEQSEMGEMRLAHMFVSICHFFLLWSAHSSSTHKHRTILFLFFLSASHLLLLLPHTAIKPWVIENKAMI